MSMEGKIPAVLEVYVAVVALADLAGSALDQQASNQALVASAVLHSLVAVSLDENWGPALVRSCPGPFEPEMHTAV